jgi:hypothetical protein
MEPERALRPRSMAGERRKRLDCCLFLKDRSTPAALGRWGGRAAPGPRLVESSFTICIGMVVDAVSREGALWSALSSVCMMVFK